MKYKTYFFLLSLITISLFLASNAFAIGIVGFHLSYEDAYQEPITLEYSFKSANYPSVYASVSGTIAPYVTLSQTSFESTHGPFSATIKMPESTPAGSYYGKVCVGENEKTGSGATLVSTSSCGSIKVYNLYENAYPVLNVNNEWIAEAEEITTSISLANYGKELLNSATVEVQLVDKEENIIKSETIKFENIESTKSDSKTVIFSTTNINPETYFIKANLQSITGENAKESVRVGKAQITSTSESFSLVKNGIQKVDIPIKSEWFEESTVFIELNINDQIFSSQQKKVPAWAKTQIPVYVETTNLELGTYTASLSGYMNDELSFEKSITIMINKLEEVKEESTQKVPIFPIVTGLLILVIIALAAVSIFRREKNNSEGEF